MKTAFTAVTLINAAAILTMHCAPIQITRLAFQTEEQYRQLTAQSTSKPIRPTMLMQRCCSRCYTMFNAMSAPNTAVTLINADALLTTNYVPSKHQISIISNEKNRHRQLTAKQSSEPICPMMLMRRCSSRRCAVFEAISASNTAVTRIDKAAQLTIRYTPTNR